MTDKEQIIIDGINVSKCCYVIDYDPPEWQGTWGGAIHKGACRVYSKDCKYNPNCYFKQLARKTAECEELKERLVRTEEDVKYQCVDCMNVKSDRYRKALEEIEELVKSLNENRMCFYDDVNDCSNCDMNTDCNYLRKFKILDIISKAKDGE